MVNFGYSIQTEEEMKSFSKSFEDSRTDVEKERDRLKYELSCVKRKYERISFTIEGLAKECPENFEVQQIYRTLKRIEKER